jgi:hypothetical protein
MSHGGQQPTGSASISSSATGAVSRFTTACDRDNCIWNFSNVTRAKHNVKRLQ